MYNKGTKLYKPYATHAPKSSKFSLTPKPSRFDLSSTQGQQSHRSSHNDYYKSLSPYILKPEPLHICHFDFNSRRPTKVRSNIT